MKQTRCHVLCLWFRVDIESELRMIGANIHRPSSVEVFGITVPYVAFGVPKDEEEGASNRDHNNNICRQMFKINMRQMSVTVIK